MKRWIWLLLLTGCDAAYDGQDALLEPFEVQGPDTADPAKVEEVDAGSKACDLCFDGYTCFEGQCVPDDGLLFDPATKLVWQNRDLPAPRTWDQAWSYCPRNEFDGPGDTWRLPTADELRSFVRDCQNTGPQGACQVSESCSWYDCGSDCDGCEWTGDCYWMNGAQGECGWYWTLTEVEDAPHKAAWQIGFMKADLSVRSATSKGYVRCVADWR